MSPLDQFFKFAVGDFVTTAAAELSSSNDPDDDGWGISGRPEVRYQIIERLVQECPGGMQVHYVAREVFASGSAGHDYLRFNEIEIVPSQKFPPRKPSLKRQMRQVSDALGEVTEQITGESK